MRIGFGFDVHQLKPERPLILGGVKVPFHLGLYGHSDADVVLHAVTDALLGALALGDIGQHFPPGDDRYAGMDSREFVRQSLAMVKEREYRLANLDITILCERPKLRPFIDEMRLQISHLLEAQLDQISVKATTMETMGFVGREEGIGAQAVVLLEKEKRMDT